MPGKRCEGEVREKGLRITSPGHGTRRNQSTGYFLNCPNQRALERLEAQKSFHLIRLLNSSSSPSSIFPSLFFPRLDLRVMNELRMILGTLVGVGVARITV